MDQGWQVRGVADALTKLMFMHTTGNEFQQNYGWWINWTGYKISLIGEKTKLDFQSQYHFTVTDKALLMQKLRDNPK